MNKFSISVILLLNVVSFSLAQVYGRAAASCGYLSQKIYCFGGVTKGGDSPEPDSNFMYLDIVNGSGSSGRELATQWTIISAILNGTIVQSRAAPQSMVLPDGKTLLLSGGWSSSSSIMDWQTVAYDADGDTWSIYPSYTEPPFGVRQIYYASSVYVPEYGVGFYGGYEANINKNWTYQGQNMSLYNFEDSNYLRKIGYTSLTFFDIRKSVDPWLVFPNQINLPADFSRSRTSIFDLESNRIFFFGGRYRNYLSPEFLFYAFNTSTTFDVTTGLWNFQKLSGFPPSERSYHTTTLLASTNRDVLLYGGEGPSNKNRSSTDYLFTLNLDSYEWKQQYITNSEALDLSRSKHSAVLVYSNTLFIFFGENISGVTISSMLILNVTDPSNISYLSTYVDPNGVVRTSSNPGLSSGAIAGIAAGAIVGGLIIITALFCMWKKKKDKKKKEELEIQRQNERIEPPIMEVDWELIEQNFVSPPRMTNDPAAVLRSKPDFGTDSLLVPEVLKHHRSKVLQKPGAES